MSMGEALANVTRAANDMAREIEALRAENATLKRRVYGLERPAVEAKRNEIRDSFAELAAAAQETRDYEGAFNIECDLREREEQWKREDAASSSGPAAGDKQPETEALCRCGHLACTSARRCADGSINGCTCKGGA